jgi:hypothetical protein
MPVRLDSTNGCNSYQNHPTSERAVSITHHKTSLQISLFVKLWRPLLSPNSLRVAEACDILTPHNRGRIIAHSNNQLQGNKRLLSAVESR